MPAMRSTNSEDDRLVDLIYDAALDETLWPDVLERLGDLVGAHPANMTQLSFLDGSGSGLAARAPDDIINRYFADWSQRNPIALADDPDSYTQGWHPRITRDGESVDRRILERSAFWNDFLVPIDAYHLAILRLSLRGTDVTTIVLGRPNRLGAFDDDEVARLAPWHRHIVRAERIWRSLGLTRSAVAHLDTLLDQSSAALFFLDDQLQLVRHTAAAEPMLRRDHGLRIVGGRLRAARLVEDASLQNALALALAAGTPAPVSVTGPLPGEGLVLSVARLTGAAAIGGGRCLLVSARPLAPPDLAATLRHRFGLTGAEAGLALALHEGTTLRRLADQRGVSLNTVRSQLAAVFDKTGQRRQQDLIRLLATLRP